ncbi:MAG: AEC family transporter [Rhodospirillaceae bacterium]|nr:AEC family transporter [Rhodospirillaceae bacterium]
MIGDLFSIIAPVFICAGIGFIWARQDHPYDTNLVTTLVTNIGAPCLVFYTLVDVKIDIEAFSTMAMASIAATALFGIISAVIIKALGANLRTFVPSMMFTNCGNMGLPLSLLAFGDPGLALAIVFFMVSAVGQFTIGMAMASGHMSPEKLARMPLLYAVAAGLAVIVTGYRPPDVFINTTNLLGGMTIPLMLITLGISLAKLKVASFGRSIGFSVLRLVMGVAVGVVLADLFGFTGVERGVLILQSAMPVAVFNYLFAVRYDRAPEEVAGMVVISTALSFATLPALLWFVL